MLLAIHSDVVTEKVVSLYLPFVRGILRSPVDCPYKMTAMMIFDVFFYVGLNNLTQTIEWLVVRNSITLMWRNCNAQMIIIFRSIFYNELVSYRGISKIEPVSIQCIPDIDIRKKLRPNPIAKFCRIVVCVLNIKNQETMWFSLLISFLCGVLVNNSNAKHVPFEILKGIL